ncbi:Short chain dehydrogenase [Phytophthora palmivora]|uniref:Short chain dehydrogenase n=1 Tax=Phytophthora palmivora TaxID=4796 RepID=A0A2P4X3J8_9STRA|nr:Short chain dehydrogenase [Phytophthora palmivora]
MTAKTVLITGSTRGIGLEFAKHFTNAGWKVIGVARNGSKADKLQDLSPFKVVRFDCTDEISIAQVAQELKGIPIDLLINNAGIYMDGGLETTTKDMLLRQFEVNTVGPFLVTRALLSNLKLAAEKNGSDGALVVTVSSQMGSIGGNKFGGNYSYGASKAAVNMVNSSLAIDLKKDNIAAIVVHPGYVVTDLTGGLGDVHTDESVRGMTSVIEKVTMKDTGKFFHFQGHEMPCNRGLGLSFAKYFIKKEWDVIATTRKGANLDDLKALSPSKIITMDVGDESSVLQMAQELRGTPIDLLINNAGTFTGSGDLRSTTKDDLMTEFEVHAVGPFLVTRSLLPNLQLAAKKNSKYGARVAHLSSVWASIETGSGPYAYAASKAALHMINHRMADEMKPHHIAAIVLDPGYVATNLTRSSYEAEADRVVNAMVGIIEKSKLKDTGKFYHFEGHEIPW